MRRLQAEVDGLVEIYQNKGVATIKLLAWSRARSCSFYCKRLEGIQGIRLCTHSVNWHAEPIFENRVVENDIDRTLHQEYCCYSYRNIACELRDLGWIINHKKVYRLVKEHRLLYGAKIRTPEFPGHPVRKLR